MSWRRDIKWPRLRAEHARELGIHETSLEVLGLPKKGAMVTARSPEGRSVRILFRCDGGRGAFLACENSVTHDK